jgi:hypothetical protein
MTDQPHEHPSSDDRATPEGYDEDELAEQAGEELPDREVMSLLDANVAIPVNAAVAANVLSDDAGAFAIADQDVDIEQAT